MHQETKQQQQQPPNKENTPIKKILPYFINCGFFVGIEKKNEGMSHEHWLC